MSPVGFQPQLRDASSTWGSGIPPRPDEMPWSADGFLLQPAFLLVAHRMPGAWLCLPCSTLSDKSYMFLLRSVLILLANSKMMLTLSLISQVRQHENRIRQQYLSCHVLPPLYLFRTFVHIVNNENLM